MKETRIEIRKKCEDGVVNIVDNDNNPIGSQTVESGEVETFVVEDLPCTSDYDFITIGYNALDTSVSVVLEQSGIVHEVVSDGAPNAIVKLNSVTVIAPFTIECGDVLSADFDPALLKSNIIFEGYYEQCYNFDITANWNLTLDSNGDVAPVTDMTSFIQFLSSGNFGWNSLSNIVVTHFSLVAGRLTCNLFADGIEVYFNNFEITEIKGVGVINGLEELDFYGNDLVGFDIIIPLPNTLNALYLSHNNLTEFNPDIALPVTLTVLGLDSNNITTAGWTESEAWANSQPSFSSTCYVDTGGNINTASGTTFESILISKNCTVNT